MTNSEQKLREIAYKHAEPKVIWNDENISIYPDEEKIESLLSDLTALISEHYVSKEKVGYPKEFVEWIGDDCSPCYLGREEDDYGKWVVFKKGSMEHEAEFDTLDELFNYWVNNKK